MFSAHSDLIRHVAGATGQRREQLGRIRQEKRKKKSKSSPQFTPDASAFQI